MTIAYPSNEFDDAVAAVCDGVASDEQMRSLNDLLRNDPKARDDYIVRLELHSRLALEAGLFLPADSEPLRELMDRKRICPPRGPVF